MAYTFEDFKLEPERFRLLRAGGEVALEPRAIDLLIFLVENRDRVATREQLLAGVWQGQNVVEGALTQAVHQLRAALGDDPRAPRFIATVRGRGYRFVAQVEEIEEPSAQSTAATSGGIARDGAHSRSPDRLDANGARRFAWRQPRAATITAAVAAALLAVMALLFARGQHGTPEVTGSLAVLPLVNATGDESLAWVELGLVDLLSRTLQAGGGIDVVPVAEVVGAVRQVSRDGDPPSDPEELGSLARTMGARWLVSAVLSRDMELYRMRTTLMADGVRPRSETISGSDLFAITDAVAERIRTWTLGGRVEATGKELVGYPRDPRQRQLFAAAMHEQFTGNSRAALRFFELLLAEDPEQPAARYEQAIALRRIGELGRSRSQAEALLVDAVASADLPLEAKVRNLVGILLWIDGEPGQAVAHFERSLELHRQLEDPRGQVSNLINLGILASERDELLQAAQRYAEALALIDRVGSMPGSEASAYNSLGVVAWMRGDVAESGRMHERALALRRRTGDRAGEAASLNNLGAVARALGELGEAEDWFHQSLALRRDLGDRRGAASTLQNLAALHTMRGRFSEADSLLIESLAIEEELGVDTIRPRILSTMGLIAKARGQWSAARELSDQLLELLRARGQMEETFAALAARVDLLVAIGELGEAQELLAEMDREVADPEHFRSHALLELSRATLQKARGSLPEAAGSLRRALDHAREAGDTELESEAIVRLSECLVESGELAEARLKLASLPGDWEEWWRLHWVLARLAFAEGDAAGALQAARRSQELAGEHWREEQETLLRAVADQVEGHPEPRTPFAPAPAG